MSGGGGGFTSPYSSGYAGYSGQQNNPYANQPQSVFGPTALGYNMGRLAQRADVSASLPNQKFNKYLYQPAPIAPTPTPTTGTGSANPFADFSAFMGGMGGSPFGGFYNPYNPYAGMGFYDPFYSFYSSQGPVPTPTPAPAPAAPAPAVSSFDISPYEKRIADLEAQLLSLSTPSPAPAAAAPAPAPAAAPAPTITAPATTTTTSEVTDYVAPAPLFGVTQPTVVTPTVGGDLAKDTLSSAESADYVQPNIFGTATTAGAAGDNTVAGGTATTAGGEGTDLSSIEKVSADTQAFLDANSFGKKDSAESLVYPVYDSATGTRFDSPADARAAGVNNFTSTPPGTTPAGTGSTAEVNTLGDLPGYSEQGVGSQTVTTPPPPGTITTVAPPPSEGTGGAGGAGGTTPVEPPPVSKTPGGYEFTSYQTYDPEFYGSSPFVAKDFQSARAYFNSEIEKQQNDVNKITQEAQEAIRKGDNKTATQLYNLLDSQQKELNLAKANLAEYNSRLTGANSMYETPQQYYNRRVNDYLKSYGAKGDQSKFTDFDLEETGYKDKATLDNTVLRQKQDLDSATAVLNEIKRKGAAYNAPDVIKQLESEVAVQKKQYDDAVALQKANASRYTGTGGKYETPQQYYERLRNDNLSKAKINELSEFNLPTYDAAKVAPTTGFGAEVKKQEAEYKQLKAAYDKIAASAYNAKPEELQSIKTAVDKEFADYNTAVKERDNSQKAYTFLTSFKPYAYKAPAFPTNAKDQTATKINSLFMNAEQQLAAQKQQLEAQVNSFGALKNDYYAKQLTSQLNNINSLISKVADDKNAMLQKIPVVKKAGGIIHNGMTNRLKRQYK